MSAITVSSSLTVTAIAGKSGKVSKGAENARALVSGMTNAGIVGAALSSKGAVGNTARAALAAHVVTLDNLLARESLDGSEWGNLLALLVGEFGIGTFNAASMKGKSGAVTYLTVTRNAIVLAFDLADTVKGQDRAKALLRQIDVVAAQVSALLAAADAARMAADAAMQAEVLALAAAADTAAADTAAADATQTEVEATQPEVEAT
jgi:hypothetical protein